MTTPHRANISNIHARLDDHDERLDALEVRLAKYDVIIERLNVLIDVLSRNVQDVKSRADDAIEGQEVAKVRNESMNRWSSIGWTVATSTVVGVAFFILGYIVHH